jgi:hypothetical protein
MGISAVAGMLLIWLLQRRYIVRRYEKDTELSRLKFFANPTFKMFDGFFRGPTFAGLYTMHLFLIWALPDGMRARLPTCSDVSDKHAVLQHFSRGERVLSVVSGLLVSIALVSLVVVAVLTVVFKVSG